jgi:hypothetical protein
MKNLYIFLVALIFLSCSIKKKISIDTSFFITNKQIAAGEVLSLSLKNNSKSNLTFLINENLNYYENYIFIKYEKLSSSMRIIVEDEEGLETNLLIGGSSAHYQDYDSYTNEIISNKYCQPIIKNLKAKKKLVINLPFRILNEDKYSTNSYEYSFKKNKKYFARVEYIPNQKVIDSLKRKGIKIYDKPIVSNKVPIVLE